MDSYINIERECVCGKGYDDDDDDDKPTLTAAPQDELGVVGF